MSRPSGLRKFVGPPAPAAAQGAPAPAAARDGPSPIPRSSPVRFRPLSGDRPSPAGRRRGTLRVLRHRHTVRTRARGGPGAVQPRLRLPGLLPALHRSASPGGRPPGTPRHFIPWQQPPGTPRHFIPWQQPPGTPRHFIPGQQPPGTPREPRLGENTPAGRLPSPGLGAIPVDPGPVSAGFVPADVRHGVGRAADPGRTGVLPEQLGAWPGRFLPEPGRRHRMHPGPGRVGAPGGRVSAAGRGGTRCGGRAAVPGQPRVRGGVLHRAHRRVLRAGRPDADAVERLRRRQRGPGEHR